jgi:alpha/beta hydrolase fold
VKRPDSLPTVAVDGGQIVYRIIGKGPPLVVLNGFGAMSSDWDPSFIDGLVSSNELILLNNRGIGGSTDDGQPFDIAKLAADAARIIERLGVKRAIVIGWSMGGFIAQALAVKYRIALPSSCRCRLTREELERILPPLTYARLLDTSGTPNEQSRVCCSCFFQTTLSNRSTANSATS